MKNELTIVVPTHNRHELLNRTLPVLCELDFPILIIDSSDVANEMASSMPCVDYVYCPGMGIIDKLRKNISERVNTPLMMMNADDIFPLKTAVNNAVDYLIDNPSYSTVQGLTFYHRNGVFWQHRKGYELFQADSSSPSTRILQHFVNDGHNFYGVHRLDCWREFFDRFPDELAGYIGEHFQVMMSLLHGKALRTGEIFHVIDSGESIETKKGDMRELFEDNKYAGQVELAKVTLCNYMYELEKVPVQAARAVIDSALSMYGVRHNDRSLYYWHDSYVEKKKKKKKTVLDRIKNEWRSLLKKTVNKKEVFARKQQQEKVVKESLEAHLSSVLSKCPPEINEEFNSIREILKEKPL